MMKDPSAHGGGSPEAPEDEPPIAQEEDAGETEDNEGFELASEEAGGARTVWLSFGWGFSLSFVSIYGFHLLSHCMQPEGLWQRAHFPAFKHTAQLLSPTAGVILGLPSLLPPIIRRKKGKRKTLPNNPKNQPDHPGPPTPPFLPGRARPPPRPYLLERPGSQPHEPRPRETAQPPSSSAPGVGGTVTSIP